MLSPKNLLPPSAGLSCRFSWIFPRAGWSKSSVGSSVPVGWLLVQSGPCTRRHQVSRVNFLFLGQEKCTYALIDEFLVVFAIVFKFALGNLQDFIEKADFNLGAISVKFLWNDLVQSSHSFPQSGIEVIFDAVVGSGSGKIYLPGNCCDISDHLFPTSLWSRKSTYSSWGVQSRARIDLSRWLWYLGLGGSTSICIVCRSFPIFRTGGACVCWSATTSAGLLPLWGIWGLCPLLRSTICVRACE